MTPPTLSYAPMTGKTIALGQLEMVELCRSVVKAPGFSKTGDTLSQVVKAAIEGRSLKVKCGGVRLLSDPTMLPSIPPSDFKAVLRLLAATLVVSPAGEVAIGSSDLRSACSS